MGGMKAERIKFSDQLRAAIDGGPKTRYQIFKETGIDEATLCRFMKGKGGLSIDGIDRVTDCLGLNLTTETRPPSEKKRKPKGT